LKMAISWLDIGEKEFLRADSNDDMNFYLMRIVYIRFYQFLYFYENLDLQNKKKFNR
jgi:hypothetical protein